MSARLVPSQLSGAAVIFFQVAVGGSGFSGVCIGLAVLIGAVDANGAGILIRYSCDVSFGLFLAAVPVFLSAAAYVREKGGYGIFLVWLKGAVLFQVWFLFLILVNGDGSVNLMTGNPQLYYSIQSALRW